MKDFNGKIVIFLKIVIHIVQTRVKNDDKENDREKLDIETMIETWSEQVNWTYRKALKVCKAREKKAVR